jgi:hypothetical protein
MRSGAVPHGGEEWDVILLLSTYMYVVKKARMARLSRLSKDTEKNPNGKTQSTKQRYRKEPQDISKRKGSILMPFHPPLNHDVYNHMEKIQPIL